MFYGTCFSLFQKLQGEREEMGKVYDDWGRLVEAVLRREKLRQLCFAHSVTSSDCSSVLDHDFPRLHLHAELTMVRLQEELIYTLTQNKQCFEHGYISPPTCESTVTSPSQSISSDCEESVVDMLDPATIPQIKAIADTMFASSCDQEFCEVFVRFGKAAIDMYFTILDMEELSYEDVDPMEWKSLHSAIKKWRLAIKKFVVLYLYKAKLVFDQVLGEYGDASSSCLIEASKPFMLLFLNLGESLAVSLDKPEHIFAVLEMYYDLVELIPSLKALFPNETASSSYILPELHHLLARLWSHVKIEFRNAISTSQFSPIRFPRGGIHPLSKYVVNYIIYFKEHDQTLSLILEDGNAEESTLAAHLHSITSAFEAKITSMSNLYDDTSLGHIFAMNNIHYMVAKIDSSKLNAYFGEEWIKRRTMTFRVHALSYLRSTWSSILPLLHCDYSVPLDRPAVSANCRDFTTAFKNVYNKQTSWCVPHVVLRQELKISASTVLVSAYRSFLGLMRNVLRAKDVGYSVHELETMIMDLLENSSKSLSHRQRKGRFSSLTSVFEPS